MMVNALTGFGVQPELFLTSTAVTADGTFVVPAGVGLLRVKAWASGGATGTYAGGGGGFAQADIAVTPGETLYVRIGGLGTNGGGAPGSAGFGSGYYGGGYTGIFRTSVAQANALVVAGGGGGSGRLGPAGPGGDGGGSTGESGGGASPGGGGSQVAGGSAGDASASAGSALQGGQGGNDESYGGSGGGGGYYGGGGGGSGTGAGGAGGGGSNYVTGTNTVSTQAVNGVAANNSDEDYTGTYGNADVGGYMVIRY